jgi:hypothetical protein
VPRTAGTREIVHDTKSERHFTPAAFVFRLAHDLQPREARPGGGRLHKRAFVTRVISSLPFVFFVASV